MTHFLLGTLAGPMAAWGRGQGLSRRSSENRPSRSAIIGLLAAALGIERCSTTALEELSESVKFGVCVKDGGRLLEDYHTVQFEVLPEPEFTRAEELRGKVRTITSHREYRTDGHWVFILSGSPDDLERYRKALLEPYFTLYLGRRACPLSRDISPIVLEAECAEEALVGYSQRTDEEATGILYADKSLKAGRTMSHIHEVRDQRQWKGERAFSVRSEVVYHAVAGEAKTGITDIYLDGGV